MALLAFTSLSWDELVLLAGWEFARPGASQSLAFIYTAGRMWKRHPTWIAKLGGDSRELQHEPGLRYRLARALEIAGPLSRYFFRIKSVSIFNGILNRALCNSISW